MIYFSLGILTILKSAACPFITEAVRETRTGSIRWRIVKNLAQPNFYRLTYASSPKRPESAGTIWNGKNSFQIFLLRSHYLSKKYSWYQKCTQKCRSSWNETMDVQNQNTGIMVELQCFIYFHGKILPDILEAHWPPKQNHIHHRNPPGGNFFLCTM